MKQTVMLRLQGKQFYDGQDPEVIELVTEGTMERLDSGWEIRYEESDMTGMAGVTTIFRVEPEQVVLTRKGRLESQMVFRLGVLHESLYQMEFGALMISVCATEIRYDINENGGTVDLTYGIDIEQSAGGVVEYHLEIESK
ncbi:MAG: DUF1934 domain-containing protein [Ruminococcaceae bacterium]|nr:DUF1934 domain-containing protein [Oscillospiraceae bacterium]MBQ3215028.1 DUF1934 domain-containing protein [Oscillospiraceae bacterium]